MSSKRAGFSLGSLLMSMIVIGLLVMATMYGKDMFAGGKSSRPDGRGKTIYGASKAKAEDEVCRSNLNQVRQGIELAHTQDMDSKYPSSIEETRLGSNFYSCPMGHEPYAYDPLSGRVSCPHPGHQTF